MCCLTHLSHLSDWRKNFRNLVEVLFQTAPLVNIFYGVLLKWFHFKMVGPGRVGMTTYVSLCQNGFVG